jgi:leucyl aminopeptidase
MNAVQLVTVDRADGSDLSAPFALGIPVAGFQLLAPGLDPDAAAAIENYLGRTPIERLSRPGSIQRLALATIAPGSVLLVGIGTTSRPDLVAAGAELARAVAGESGPVTFALPPLSLEGSAALVEGLLLGGYRFQVTVADARAREVATIRLLGADPAGVELGSSIATSTTWARELANTRSSVKTPAWLAEQARAELTPFGVTVTERDVDWLTEAGFGGVLAVGSGSAAPPRLIEAAWAPRGAPAAPHVVLVGKSITYDSGGINIKPLDSMTSMYTDMAGGAAVLGTLRLVAELKLPIRVTGLLPAAENSVSGSAMRQTDVIRHFGGRTSEVNNTDAEGRLVLADAIAYAAARLKPTVIIDLATLTGAMKVALGTRTAGLFATSDELADGLLAAGSAVGEPLWRLPLADDYQSTLTSDIADANNSPGNPGGIAAALFLRPFAAGRPWAHLDIAGPARASEDDAEISRGATGYGVRLLGEWLRRQIS